MCRGKLSGLVEDGSTAMIEKGVERRGWSRLLGLGLEVAVARSGGLGFLGLGLGRATGDGGSGDRG